MEKNQAFRPISKPKPRRRKVNRFIHNKGVMNANSLKEYRRIQREIVYIRAHGWCEVCFHLNHIRREGVDVHHVFGRARTLEYAEQYERADRLLLLCRGCHIKLHDTGELTRETLVELLDKINNAYKNLQET